MESTGKGMYVLVEGFFPGSITRLQLDCVKMYGVCISCRE